MIIIFGAWHHGYFGLEPYLSHTEHEASVQSLPNDFNKRKHLAVVDTANLYSLKPCLKDTAQVRKNDETIRVYYLPSFLLIIAFFICANVSMMTDGSARFL